MALVRNQAIIPQEHSEITEEPNRAIDMIEKVGQETPSQVHPTRLPASTAAPRVSSLPGSPTELLKSDHAMCLIQPPSLPLTEHTSPSPSSEASACDASPLGIHAIHSFKSAQIYCPVRPVLTTLIKTATIPTPFTLCYFFHSTHTFMNHNSYNHHSS